MWVMIFCCIVIPRTKCRANFMLHHFSFLLDNMKKWSWKNCRKLGEGSVSNWFLVWDNQWFLHKNAGNMYFLHDRPWISPWIKSISNELDIIIHVIASQLSGHCDVISSRLWRHQHNVDWASEPRGRCVKIFVFIVVYGFVMSCKK